MKPKNWYQELISRANSLSEEFGLDDMQTSDLRSFVVTTAKSHFKAGSKSGAAYAYRQKSEPRIGHPQTPVAA